MVVYIVSVICDHEYFCRAVDKVFANFQDAQDYITSKGNPMEHPWTGGDDIPVYVIDTWKVD